MRKQEVGDKFFPQQNEAETSSLAMEVAMQVLREEFPGDEHVWSFYPHLGRIYGRAFPLYKQIFFRPAVDFKRVYSDSKIPLYILRHDKSFGAFPASKDGPYFNLSTASSNNSINTLDFEVRLKPGAEKIGFTDVAKNFETWLRNKISAVLDKFDYHLKLQVWREHLVGKSGDAFSSPQPYFIPNGWKWWEGKIKPDFENLKPLEFQIEVNDKLYGYTGLVLPQSKTIRGPWHSVIPPKSDFRRMIDKMVEWYFEWYQLIELNRNTDVTINFENVWGRYQADMRPFEEHFKEN